MRRFLQLAALAGAAAYLLYDFSQQGPLSGLLVPSAEKMARQRCADLPASERAACIEALKRGGTHTTLEELPIKDGWYTSSDGRFRVEAGGDFTAGVINRRGLLD